MEPLTHSIKNHSEWNESYYLCFSDRKNNISGMTRLGFKPNKNEAMVFFLLFLSDGSVAGFQSSEEIKNYPKSLEAAGMTYERQVDGTWKYRFKGKMVKVQKAEDFVKIQQNPKLITKIMNVVMSLDFKPIHETYEYSENMTPESLELGKKSGDQHWEQIALINGEINLDNEKYTLKDVIGERDHTHGVRDWTGIGNWIYYVVWFNSNLAVNPAAIITDDGRISTGGFLYRNGKNIPIKNLKVIKQEYKDGIIPISSTLELIDANGEKHILMGKAGSVIPIPFKDAGGKTSILSQSFGEFELDGVKGGYGSFETLRILKGS